MGFIEVIIALVVFLIWFSTQDNAKPASTKKKVSFAETRSEILYDKKTGNIIGSACAPT